MKAAFIALGLILFIFLSGCTFEIGEVEEPRCGDFILSVGEECESDVHCEGHEECQGCQCISLVTGVCGNGIVEGGENCSNCPRDVWCAENQLCLAGRCETPECKFDDDCHDFDPCTIDTCHNNRCYRREDKDIVGCEICGDTIISAAEECESNADCRSDEVCSDCQCVSAYVAPAICGNNQVESGEDCESLIDCVAGKVCVDCACVSSSCGDGVVYGSEDCEADADCESGEACEACQCQVMVGCGNDQLESGEECESDSDCSSDEFCENCNCYPQVCGDNRKTGSEECESNSDCGLNEVCSNCQCQSAPPAECGNLIVESPEACELDSQCSQGEACVDCSCVASAPEGPVCGNLIKEAGEECEVDSDCGDPVLECNLCGCYSTVECNNYLLDCYFELGPDYHCRTEGYTGKCYPNSYITSTEPCLNTYSATVGDGERTREILTGFCSHIPCENCSDRFGEPTQICMPDLLVCLECYSDLDCDSSYICQDYQCVDRECTWDEDCNPLYDCEDHRCMPA